MAIQRKERHGPNGSKAKSLDEGAGPGSPSPEDTGNQVGVAVERACHGCVVNGAVSANLHNLPSDAIPSAPTTTSPVRPAQSAPQPAKTIALADRLAAANELRHSGQWQSAEQAYLDIVARYPLVPEASIASFAAASLRLEHLADPAGALQLYQSLTRTSALGVEVLYGVARCHQALADTNAEIAALRHVVVAYPTSLQADRARERLQQIAPASATP